MTILELYTVHNIIIKREEITLQAQRQIVKYMTLLLLLLSYSLFLFMREFYFMVIKKKNEVMNFVDRYPSTTSLVTALTINNVSIS